MVVHSKVTIDCSYMFKNNLRLFQLCDVIQNADLDPLRKSIQGYSKHFIMALSARVEFAYGLSLETDAGR